MSCSTFSSLASNTRSFAYFTVWMICPPILKSPNLSKASLVRYSLYKLNRIGDKQHPCLTPLPISTLLVSPRFSRTLTLWAMYKLLINLLSRQSIPFSFRICINLITNHNHHWLDSPWWALAFLRSFAHSYLSRATFFQFLTSNILIHWWTPSSHRNFGLPTLLTPSGFVLNILFTVLSLFIRIKCPARANL